jgi:aspartyl-tRNA(Asn)/glutamyl-tRNA(Gln) amidotransferase subunit A
MKDEVCFLSAEELALRYRRRELSPREVTQAVLDRIESVNPRINALHFVDSDGAMAAAAAAEERWRRNEPLGELDGIPVTLKDSIPVAGMPMPWTARRGAGRFGSEGDAPSARRLREAGAVLIGKTTMPDLGMIPSGISSAYGVTRNPWNLERNSGGSSSGAGAAVAAGLGALAVGSDMGGSVRIPAAFCGIVGLKPSYGRVPLADPWQALVAGPMARSVGDLARMLTLIARPDPRDYTSLPWDDRDYLAHLDAGVRGLRIGLMLDIGFGIPVQEEVRALVESAAAAFGLLGAAVEPMPPIFDEDPEPDFDRMMQAYAWAEFDLLGPEERSWVMPEIADWCRQGESLGAVALTRASIGIGETRRRVIAATAPYDLVLSPTMGMAAFDANLPWASGGSRHNPFCFPFNLSEQPAVSICCGFTASGLPVGLQIVGRRFDDAGVLRAARAYESVRPPLPRRPRL